VRAIVSAHGGRLALGLLLMLVNRLCGFAVPATAKLLIDDVIGRQQWQLLPGLAAAVGAAAIGAAVTGYALSQVLAVVAAKTVAETRQAVQSHVVRLPILSSSRLKTGEWVTRIMHDAESVRAFVGRDLVQVVSASLMALLALGALLYLNSTLTLALLIVLGAFGGTIVVTSMRLRPLFQARGEIMAETTGRLHEMLSGIRVVKAYAAEDREARQFSVHADRLLDNLTRTLTGIAATTACATAVLGAIGTILILMGGGAVRRGDMTPGDLAMYVSFLALLTLPVAQLAAVAPPIGDAIAGLDRLAAVRGLPTEDEEDAGRPALSQVRGDVVLERVSFEYSPGVPVLKQVSLAAAAGTTTAIVGSSGSGKTTLMNLLVALHRPTSGRILVDGHDLSAVRRSSYRRHLGVVLQDDFLFDGTIAENIAFGVADANRDAIEEAGRLAHCDEFTGRFADGYDTIIGERGVRLSGGQRQRLSIARALLADPRILMLDEATSSLDSETETLIQDALRALRRGRTAFVIAHRLSTIMSADQIVVLERGEVVERGSHEALLERGGRYSELYHRQYGRSLRESAASGGRG
jgi:ABC-type multidrug transport system fused ATPase/permease subunit